MPPPPPRTDLRQAFAQAVQLHQAGRLPEAEAIGRRILQAQPRNGDALQLLGVIAAQRGDFPRAAQLLKSAIANNPRAPGYHYNFGRVLDALGRLDEAVASYHRALDLHPKAPEAHLNLGNALVKLGRDDEALRHYGEALKQQPNFALAHNNIGNIWKTRGHYAEAIESYRRAVGVEPRYAEGHFNLGIALRDIGELDGAVAAYRRAEALDPNYAEAHYNEALVLLLQGDYLGGWAKYEWRNAAGAVVPRDLPQPQWRGEPLDDRTLLLHGEQGLGDTLQFLRYLPLVTARGGRVLLEVQPPLRRLVEQQGYPVEVLARSETVPESDLRCSLLSLPHVFATTLQTIPLETPYLRVGLVWAGNPKQKNDHNRSIPLARLQALLEVEGVEWISLQVGERAADLAGLPSGLVGDPTPLLTDFAETAGLVDNLDLVVTVDTSVSHLAAALGKPTWVLLSQLADWRFPYGRAEAPWYPTMRVFRQEELGAWDPVIAGAADALRARAQGSS